LPLAYIEVIQKPITYVYTHSTTDSRFHHILVIKIEIRYVKAYMHIPQSSVHPLLRTHRIEASSGISSVRHHTHLEKKYNTINKLKQVQAIQTCLLEVQSDNSLNVPFSIQSISLRDSASTGNSFLIFISVIKA
jgi:hypothetical protein